MSTFASSSTRHLLPRRLLRLPPSCYSSQHHRFFSSSSPSSSCPPVQHHGLWINDESRPALNGLTHTLQSPATRQDLGHVVSIAEGTSFTLEASARRHWSSVCLFVFPPHSTVEPTISLVFILAWGLLLPVLILLSKFLSIALCLLLPVLFLLSYFQWFYRV